MLPRIMPSCHQSGMSKADMDSDPRRSNLPEPDGRFLYPACGWPGSCLEWR
jgi:hypothetical protein